MKRRVIVSVVGMLFGVSLLLVSEALSWSRPDEGYSEAVCRAAGSAGIALVDCARLVPSDPSLFLGDGYYPNEAGFQVMAASIVKTVRDLDLLAGASGRRLELHPRGEREAGGADGVLAQVSVHEP